MYGRKLSVDLLTGTSPDYLVCGKILEVDQHVERDVDPQIDVEVSDLPIKKGDVIVRVALTCQENQKSRNSKSSEDP